MCRSIVKHLHSLRSAYSRHRFFLHKDSVINLCAFNVSYIKAHLATIVAGEVAERWQKVGTSAALHCDELERYHCERSLLLRHRACSTQPDDLLCWVRRPEPVEHVRPKTKSGHRMHQLLCNGVDQVAHANRIQWPCSD